MSDKTEILSSDEWYSEAKKLNDDGFSAKDLFEAGQQSKQAEVDELKKRIESAMELLEYNEYVDSALQALEILKGEETK